MTRGFSSQLGHRCPIHILIIIVIHIVIIIDGMVHHHDLITLYVDQFGLLKFHGSYCMDSSQAQVWSKHPHHHQVHCHICHCHLYLHHHLDDQVHIGWVSRKIASLQLLCRSLGNLFLGKKKHFGEVTFEEITFRDFQMPQRQRPERFLVSKFRTNSIEDPKSNPSHTQTTFTHCPILCMVRFQGSNLNVKL